MKISQKAEAFRKSRIRRHAWQRVVFGAACVVVFCTVYALILPAITLEEEVFCGLQEHVHGEECYEQHLICTLEEGIAPHVHSEECRQMQSVLSCALQEQEGHTHSETCFDAENPDVLLCGLEEAPQHTHDETCYTEQSVLVCTVEEDLEPHVHGEACFETLLICEQEEHTHSLLCYSNPDADKESRSQWERTLPKTLTGDWAQDIVAIAQSQLGYAESTKNYTLAEDGSKKGYTRYGDWYGNPYGEWCAMFVSFCSQYAGVPRDAMLHEMSCMRMVNNLTAVGVFHKASEGYTPQPGDIVFFQRAGEAIPGHVGIVTAVSGSNMTTIEGNRSNQVAKASYALDDGGILGFASMAEIMERFAPAPTAEPSVEPSMEPSADASAEPAEPAESSVPSSEEPEESLQPESTPAPSENGAEDTPLPSEEAAAEPTPAMEEPVPTAEPAAPILPEISIVSDENDTSHGRSDAYALAGETVYFRVSAIRPVKAADHEPQDTIVPVAEENALPSADENKDEAPADIEEVSPAPQQEQDVVPEATEEPEVKDSEPLPTEDPSAPLEQESFLEEAPVEEPSMDSSLLVTLPATKGLFDWRLEDTAEPGAVWVTSEGEISLQTGENGLQYLVIQKAESAIVRLTFPEGEVYSAFANGLNGQADTLVSYEDSTASVSHLLMTETPACGLTAHTHREDCYGEDGECLCGLIEHTHGELCFLGHQTVFAYEDGELSMSVTAYSREPLPEGTVLTVAPLEEEEACLRYADFAQTLSPEEGAALLLRRVYLSVNDAPLDEDAYRLTASVQVNMDVTSAMVELLSLNEEEESTAADKGIIVTALEGSSDGVSEGESVLAALGEEIPALTIALQNGELALLASTTANPTYTVQYYAWIPRFADSGEKALTVIDTTGKKLPSNGGGNKEKYLYLKKTGKKTEHNSGSQTELYEVATDLVLTQMYTDNVYEYVKAPNPSYVNKLLDNESYVLKKIWVLKSGKDSASTDENDWDIYNPGDIHFTNRAEIADASKNIVYLTADTVLRMVYEVAESSFTASGVNFYDYNISNGKTSDGRLETGTVGINSKENYSDGTKWDARVGVLAFGNSNCGTGMGWFKTNGGKYLNQYGGSATYGCTFGLAKSLKDGMIQYADGIYVPNLFNDGTAKGKKGFSGSLTFTQVGDTYTLSSAGVSGADGVSNLQNFFNPSTPAKVHTSIFTNNFWPMDNANDAVDPMFGKYGNGVTYRGFADADNAVGGNEDGTLPVSDDGNAHNSFFGMQFAISFELTEDYVGPLEYYFFGDDDMWVFLDNTLVCDIGGVHSSVGEYVDLWDYLEKGKAGVHKLTFFYTERGASGSTCYMNFTLPSVTGASISQKTGSLRVEKEVVGEHNPGEEFEFQINFFEPDGTTRILDDYVYTRYDANGKELNSDLIIHDGGSFKLCAGEHVIIQYLPYGVQYEIVEVAKEGYKTSCKVDGVIQEGSTAHSTIVRGATNTVTFTNTVNRTNLKLKKLGMNGMETIPLSDVTFTLSDSGGNTVHVVDRGGGAYEVPISSAGIAQGAEYYIALASNPNFVVGVSSLSQGTQLTLQSKNGDTGQKKWVVYRQKDGSYSFLLPGTNQWMDLDSGNTENGHKVHLWGNDNVPSDNDNHKWFLQPNSDGTFTLKPRAAVLNGSNAVLDLNGGTVSVGVAIQVYASNGSDAQKWLLVPVNPAAAAQTVTEVKTNERGELTVSNLIPGVYTLTEITPDGYKGLQPIKVRVKAGGKLELAEDTNNGLVTVGEDGLLLQVQNVPVDKTLTLTKKVNGVTDKTQFTFKVSYQVGETLIEKEISLKNGESILIEGIPHGAAVTIAEENHDGFTVAYSKAEGEQETLIANESSVTIENVTEDLVIIATNTVHYSLPQTGGGGTQWFITAGMLLTTGSLLFGYRRRRREHPALSTTEEEQM